MENTIGFIMISIVVIVVLIGAGLAIKKSRE